jgi:LacI family transcriptional regulator
MAHRQTTAPVPNPRRPTPARSRLSSARSGKPTAGRARLVDVANRANVSKSTASRVINGAAINVSQTTRQRILGAVRELGYTPNAVAQALSMRSSGAIALLVPAPVSIAYTEMFQRVLTYAAERGMPAIVVIDVERAASELTLRSLVSTGRVDGVIVVSSFEGDERFDFLQSEEVPHVYMMRAMPGSTHNVLIDDEKVSAVAVEHLYELGHRRLAHVAGFSSIEATARRAKGFLSRCADLGIVGFVHEAELNERGGFDAFRPLSDARQAPTAVYTAMVGQALGVMRAAHSAGMQVPGDLSIITFDNVPMCDYVTPSLTSIGIPVDSLARHAVDSLLAQIEGGRPENVVVPTEPVVLVRESTGRPRAASSV